ncbi:expressed unknown protein [Seminavis robusta]|uniref:Uncharacterized protein n=1 Tax=Seminavis robusta TaxID=568900 RepID=A0A9N8H3M4_9STRA|nr:expressed unknown protein [Seminavis robusta]|eukprot:Sro42_g025690.1 n/a (311) ;mRNA; r:93131-94063
MTPLEQALCSILTELMPLLSLQQKDQQQHPDWVVEYWSRDEYINLDAHSDIDEQLLLREGSIRCPTWAHVLYLDVVPDLRGPTCVFSQMGGWNGQTVSDAATTSVISVPALPGRLLKFPGAAMHAVPKPTSLWFMNENDQDEMLAKEEEEEEEDFDYDDDDDDRTERSVILFNVWQGDGPGGVQEDLIEKGILPDGIGLAADDSNDNYMAKEKERRVELWNEDYGAGCRDLKCKPRTEWQRVDIVDSSNKQNTKSEKTTIRVPLMGNKKRHLHANGRAHLTSPARLLNALEDKSTPHHFVLHQTGSGCSK